jgi:hypothetical protein
MNVRVGTESFLLRHPGPASKRADWLSVVGPGTLEWVPFSTVSVTAPGGGRMPRVSQCHGVKGLLGVADVPRDGRACWSSGGR